MVNEQGSTGGLPGPYTPCVGIWKAVWRIRLELSGRNAVCDRAHSGTRLLSERRGESR